MNIKVIPAIIPEDFADLRQHLLEIKGIAKRVQVDIVDSRYALGADASWPLNGADPDEFKKIIDQEEGLPYWQDIDFDIDLMVKEPIKEAKLWATAGASRLIFHLGSLTETVSVQDFQEIASVVEIGFAFIPSAPIEEELKKIKKYCEEKIQPTLLQCMGSSEIGKQGTHLEKIALEKVAKLRAEFPEIDISVDIGVNDQTAQSIIEAGANVLVAGSYIFKSENPRNAIMRLKNAHNGTPNNFKDQG